MIESKHLTNLREIVSKGTNVLIEGLWESPKALIAALAKESTGKHILILTAKSREEASLYHDFPYFTSSPVIDFPAWETLPSENTPPSADIVGERYEALEKIIESKEPLILLASLQATLQKMIDPAHFYSLHFALKQGDQCPFDRFIERLLEMGYQRRSVASDKGDFAVRGGIIDVFPVSKPDPYRIEFFGDEIESIRIYDPIGQKSIRPVDVLSINPAQELELLNNTPKLSTLFDYLGPNTLVILDDIVSLEDRYASLKGMLSRPTPSFGSIDELFEQLKSTQTIYLSEQPIEELSETTRQGEMLSFDLFGQQILAHRWHSYFQHIGNYLFADQGEGFSEEELFEALQSQERSEERSQEHWHFLFATELEKKTFERKLEEATVQLPPNSKTEIAYLSNGFVVSDTREIFLPMTELTKRYKLRRQKHRSTFHTTPTESYELEPGDMVVHLNHGIGRYLGMEKRPNNLGVDSEFFVLEYSNQAKLFVPLNQAHLITKYIGATDETPKMHEIGSSRWKKAKEKTQQAILGYAKDLVDFYAQRVLAGGHTYPADSPDMEAFENDFPYDETKDQLDAIASVKRDMQSEKSMDRLVCGDVGYGKTEVAMRAAFKAVVDGGKQVAVLVPTTVLAMQHYENFIERMRHFPVTIGVLSRFQTLKETRTTLENVTNGSVDILVGTHRIISDDVKFKDLGLVIIDEEQRFGVKAKEHLKQVKLGVECLTLSATPIPRTLYLSLMGARDLSVINTPPQDRLPIKSVITQLDDHLLKNVVMRELARDGQVYVIHNRVETIFNMADRIKKLLPQARIIVGHGQMSSNELDKVFHAFKSGEADILVATSIVENGIDIPNANTILIDRADLFGLADLYQLRGRVGRWNRQAYCYFLVPNLHLMPEITRKRLSALAETSGYGGGMKVALRDLEIRGAGNILGVEQSGQVEAIGFHQYCKWLKRAVQTLQGKLAPALTDTKIECAIDARLPEDYVNEISLRMEFYQRLGETLNLDEVNEIHNEMLDRFGPLPIQAQWLISLTRLKVHATQKNITAVHIQKVSITVEYKKGGQTITQNVLFQAPKTPKDWEEQLIKLLDNL